MAAFLNQSTFFFNLDVFDWLLSHSENEKMELALEEGENLALNVIDQPFCTLISRDNQMLRIKIYIRKEIGILEDSPDLEMALPTDGGQGQVKKNSNALGGDPNELLGMFFNAGMTLRKYVFDHDLLDQCTDMEENEGVVVKAKGEDLIFKSVAGKKRPDLSATNLFGGTTMCRAYMDEISIDFDPTFLSEQQKIDLAEEGDEDMMQNLAMGYLYGDHGLDQNPEQAFYWFQKLSELENETAQYNLGLLYAKGFGVERNLEKAAFWMERAGENGDDDGASLAKKYLKMQENLKKAEAGDAQAQANLAGDFMASAGSLKPAGAGEDYKLALYWAEKSAAQNNGKGLWILALAYEHGRGVEEDKEKAVEIYRRGADLGNAACQHSLGCYYLRGEIVEKNNETGFELCLKSAQQGYGLALKTVGTCYQFGTGVMGNLQTSMEWYEKALEVSYDPELAEKVELMHALSESEPDWGKDFEGNDDGWTGGEDEADDSETPAGFEEAMEFMSFAEKLGYAMGDNFDAADLIEFMKKQAESGDMKAKYVTAKFFVSNGIEPELGEQWLQELIDAGYEEE